MSTSTSHGFARDALSKLSCRKSTIRARSFLYRGSSRYRKNDLARHYSDQAAPSSADDAPKWRASRREIVVNDLEATLDAHRRAIAAAKHSLGGDDNGRLPQVPDQEQTHAALQPGVGNSVQHVLSGAKSSTGARKRNRLELGVLPELPVVRKVLKVSNDPKTQKLAKPAKHKELQPPWNMPKDLQFPYRTRLRRINRPWINDNMNTFPDALEELTYEMKRFDRYMNYTREEAIAVQRCIDDATSLIEKTVPGQIMTLQGSHATGLATAMSDVDIVMSLPKISRGASSGDTESLSTTHPEMKKAYSRALMTLKSAIEADSNFGFVFYIDAKIPLLNVAHRATGLKVQIVGTDAAGSALEYTKYYLVEYPKITRLHRVLSHALRMRKLNDPSDGGIGSYTLFCMIIAVLKRRPPVKQWTQANRLLEFLKFWSDADAFDNGYGVDPPRTFPKAHKDLVITDVKPLPHDEDARSGASFLASTIWRKRRTDPNYKMHNLCLQDPADFYNDLGHNSHNFPVVQATFKKIYEEMLEAIAHWDAAEPGENGQYEARAHMQVMLHPLVGGNYGWLKMHRARLREVGSQTDPTDGIDAPGPSTKLRLTWTDQYSAEGTKRLAKYARKSEEQNDEVIHETNPVSAELVADPLR